MAAVVKESSENNDLRVECDVGLFGEREVQAEGQLGPRPYGMCVPEGTMITKTAVNAAECP